MSCERLYVGADVLGSVLGRRSSHIEHLVPHRGECDVVRDSKITVFIFATKAIYFIDEFIEIEVRQVFKFKELA